MRQLLKVSGHCDLSMSPFNTQDVRAERDSCILVVGNQRRSGWRQLPKAVQPMPRYGDFKDVTWISWCMRKWKQSITQTSPANSQTMMYPKQTPRSRNNVPRGLSTSVFATRQRGGLSETENMTKLSHLWANRSDCCACPRAGSGPSFIFLPDHKPEWQEPLSTLGTGMPLDFSRVRSPCCSEPNKPYFHLTSSVFLVVFGW